MHPLKCSFMDSRRNIKNVSAITYLWRRLHSWKPVCSPLWRTEGAQCVLPRSQQCLLLSSKTLYHLLCNHLQENKSHDVLLTVEKLGKVNLSHFTGCIFISLREIRMPGSCNWFRVSLMNHTAVCKCWLHEIFMGMCVSADRQADTKCMSSMTANSFMAARTAEHVI